MVALLFPSSSTRLSNCYTFSVSSYCLLQQGKSKLTSVWPSLPWPLSMTHGRIQQQERALYASNSWVAMSILLLSTAWLLFPNASLWRCGNTTRGVKKTGGKVKSHEVHMRGRAKTLALVHYSTFFNIILWCFFFFFFFKSIQYFCPPHKLIPKARLCIRSDPSKCPDDLHVQRVLVLVLRVFQEWRQLHFYALQQLHTHTQTKTQMIF